MANPSPGQPHAAPPWRWMGERGLRLETGDATLACYEMLSNGEFEEIVDVIPADGSILLLLRPGAAPSPKLAQALRAPLGEVARAKPARHTLRVEFGGAAGPDLAECAAHAALGVEDYLAALTAATYTVAFLGFQPGFPYLTGLPAGLAAPRRATPRTRVPAGSVAIGGPYAGIYPADGPGGWNLLGRTAARLFDPARAAPALLQPGDQVRFVAC